MLQSSNKFSATANVLKEFLHISDRLVELREKYNDDEFGQQYAALPGAMGTAFTQLGVTDFGVPAGSPIDPDRMIVVESAHSADHPKDTVLEALCGGIELNGNVIRMAEVIASLGPPEALPASDSEPGDDDEMAAEHKQPSQDEESAKE
jgi:molecular chaperone GrpE (heat shock protein)